MRCTNRSHYLKLKVAQGSVDRRLRNVVPSDSDLIVPRVQIEFGEVLASLHCVKEIVHVG